jgi:hypothetical protein
MGLNVTFETTLIRSAYAAQISDQRLCTTHAALINGAIYFFNLASLYSRVWNDAVLIALYKPVLAPSWSRVSQQQ